MPIEACGVVAGEHARVQIKDVRGNRQVEPGGFNFELPAQVRRGLKLNGFGGGHSYHYRLDFADRQAPIRKISNELAKRGDEFTGKGLNSVLIPQAESLPRCGGKTRIEC